MKSSIKLKIKIKNNRREVKINYSVEIEYTTIR